MSLVPKLLIAGVLGSAATLHAQLPVGELYASDASVHGSIELVSGGATVLSGSSISSGNRTALLKLSRGGELSICSGTHVSVSASANARDLMFSFGTGAIETRYRVSTAADTIVTPDLRLLITGPGEFDLAVGISPNGDTCVLSSKGSTGGVIVSEMMGDGSYQVKPSEFVVFRAGKVTGAQVNPTGGQCGCPAAPPLAIAKVEELKTQRPASFPPSLQQPMYTQPEYLPSEPVQADLRLSFRGKPQDEDLSNRVARLNARTMPLATVLVPVALPPAETAIKKEKRGFWKRLGAWFRGEGYH